jgi:HEAT repeat protein
VFPYLEFLGEPVARYLVGRLGDENDRARRGRMVEAVRRMGAASLPALLEALTSPAWYLVRNALTLMPDLGDAGCMPAVLPLLRHPEPRVRRTAVRALWKLGGPAAEPHLLALMKSVDAGTMQEILFALGQLRSEAGLPQVMDLARDKRVVEQIRIQALETLGTISSPQAMPVLLECLRRRGFFGGGEQPVIRLAAAKALLVLDTPEAIQALQRLADTEPKGDEREAFRRLLEPAAQS